LRLRPRANDSDKEQAMSTGTVKWYNETKGYGFIQPDDGGKDIFVHATALERAGMRGLREGQKISYELQTDQRTGKTSAVNLQNA
jgi:CspA family cold shock protein